MELGPGPRLACHLTGPILLSWEMLQMAMAQSSKLQANSSARMSSRQSDDDSVCFVTSVWAARLETQHAARKCNHEAPSNFSKPGEIYGLKKLRAGSHSSKTIPVSSASAILLGRGPNSFSRSYSRPPPYSMGTERCLLRAACEAALVPAIRCLVIQTLGTFLLSCVLHNEVP